jgi:oligopeptide transport system substrate-binding protein
MKFLTKYLALLLISFLVVGCTGGKVEGDDLILKVAKSSDVISLDTHVATDGVSFEVIKAFTEGLVEYDADGNIIAGVAKTWDVSADGKVYTFTLREDAFWSNGTKVTAADFVYGFQRLADPAKTHQYSYLVESLKIVNGADVIAGTKPVTELGVKAEGDFKFVVTLDAAVPYFMQLMTFPSFHPVNKAFAEAAGDKYATTVEFLISNGPFVLTEWISGSLIKFGKNDKYWDKAAVKLDGLEFQIFKDYQSAALEFEAGTVDVTAITSNIVDRYKDNAGYTEVKLGYVWFLSPNQMNVTMQNKNLRLALAHAFDRAQIADNLLGDGSIVATGIVSSGLVTGPNGKDFRDDSGVYQAMDVAKAKAFWEAAKTELGVTTLTIELLVGSPETDTGLAVGTAEFLKSEFEKNLPGLTIQIKTTIKKDRLDLMNTGNYQLGLTRWGPDFADPLTYLKDLFETGSPYNYPRFSNAEYDAIIASVSPGGSLAADLTVRWNTLKQAEALLLGEAGVIPAWQTGTAMLISTKVTGIEYHVVGMPCYKRVTKVK